MFENFLSPSKDDLLKVIFAWTKKIFTIFQKNKLAQNFFKGISRRKVFGPYRNFPTLVKFFKKLKSRFEGQNAFFFVFLFLYPG